jgi:ABC-type phosphate transport system substrate-binding protein
MDVEEKMNRARVWVVRAAIVGAALGAAACDAASNVGSPLSPTSARRDAATSSGSTTVQPMTMSSDSTVTCRSGYQVAYRSDGSMYCVPEQQ